MAMQTLQDVPEAKAAAVSSGEKLSLERKGLRDKPLRLQGIQAACQQRQQVFFSGS